MSQSEKSLESLRRKIDQVDNQIHDLIMERTRIVEAVRDAKEGQRVKIRPSREAQILSRLVERHKGAFPKRELVRIWREMIVATLAFEGPFSVAVLGDGSEPAFWDLARDQYGSFTPMTGYGSPRRVLDAVRSQAATVGILPVPRQDDLEPWWPHLVTESKDAPRVIARLPFTGPGGGRTGSLEALVICPILLEGTGNDRSYLAVEAEDQIGTSQFRSSLAEAGFDTEFTITWKDADEPDRWLHLAQVEGLVLPQDARIPVLVEEIPAGHPRVVPLGGYAVPLSPEQLA